MTQRIVVIAITDVEPLGKLCVLVLNIVAPAKRVLESTETNSSAMKCRFSIQYNLEAAWKIFEISLLPSNLSQGCVKRFVKVQSGMSGVCPTHEMNVCTFEPWIVVEPLSIATPIALMKYLSDV